MRGFLLRRCARMWGLWQNLTVFKASWELVEGITSLIYKQSRYCEKSAFQTPGCRNRRHSFFSSFICLRYTVLSWDWLNNPDSMPVSLPVQDIEWLRTLSGFCQHYGNMNTYFLSDLKPKCLNTFDILMLFARHFICREALSKQPCRVGPKY